MQTQPQAALASAEAILKQAPEMPAAELLACQALRRVGQVEAALARLSALDSKHPGVPAVLWEFAQAASETGNPDKAIAALEILTRKQAAIAGGWFLLAKELRKVGKQDAAWRADLSAVKASARDPQLLKAAMAMNEGRYDVAEELLGARLERMPDDASAYRLLGEIHWRRGDMSEALELVDKAVTLAPGFDLAREFLIRLLLQNNRLIEALEQAEILAMSPVKYPGHDLLMASVLVALGDQERASAIYREILSKEPEHPQVWQNLGHALKTMGKQSEAVHAYRQSVTFRPTMGEAWWSLANLKTVKLGAADIAAMERALEELDEADEQALEDVFHLHFSLGKALEDAGDYAASFRHYAQGNRLRRSVLQHDATEFSAEVAATAKAFSAGFMAQLEEGGCPAPDPIFVVGLPRSGSTLVEQILASHSMIEGTMELPEMMIIASRLQARLDAGEFADFATMIASLSPSERARLGAEYIERTRVHRKTDAPFFIDKMPNNWQHVGLIRLILPNAKIIDARRHPMSCCFSGWKQHFARGQTYTYDLAEIGHYYRDYTSLMAAYDAAAPGAVHRVHYESMIAQTESEIRSLLGYLELPFEPACVEFHKNDRAVRTASSEQVRQPIYQSGLSQWEHFKPWLGPLEQALGPLAQTYPKLPD